MQPDITCSKSEAGSTGDATRASSQEVQFQSRIPIYPRSVQGRYRTLKWMILVLAYGTYFLLPWLRWQRAQGPDQAVLFDIQGRLFYLFGLVVHPQDIFWLAGFLIVAALLLFFVTGIAGRAFCGYFCFQTLWTDVYVLIERLVQGERPARIRLDKSDWGPEKILKKSLTHALWLIVAFSTGITFTFYWGDAPLLIQDFFHGEAPFPAYATTLFLTATTYVMAGMAREQVCTYMCPYARFQSVMFDRDTLIVSYDVQRGERGIGRAKLNRTSKTPEQRKSSDMGDCIDCGYCVQVCPTGIDIRDGLQIQCISCALCIDACNTIMDNLHWPRGLIRYASENSILGIKTRIIKAKTIAYGFALALACGLLIWSVVSQSTLDIAVEQTRNPLYVVLSDGAIQNSYVIKINNKSNQPQSYRIAISGLEHAVLDLGHIEEIVVQAHKGLSVHARVRMAPSNHRSQVPFTFHISNVTNPDLQVSHEVAFSLPKSTSEHL